MNQSNLILATAAIVCTAEVAAVIVINCHRMPLPSGYLIIGVLLIANYVVAHRYRKSAGYLKYVKSATPAA